MERGFRTSVVEVFQDFMVRRAAIIQALTTESEEFYQQCNPDTENDFCLYGLPNETWEVNLPAEEIPPELPEPLIGINIARDGMERTDWLAFVAVHSDAWLLALASYNGARFGFDKNHRNQLFGMINDLPTIFEVVKSPPIPKGEEKASASIQSSRNKPKSSAFSCWAKLRELCIGALGFRKPKTYESDETESGSTMEVEWGGLKEKMAEEEDEKQNGEVLSRDWEEGDWEEEEEEEEEDEEEVSRSNKRARSE